MTGAMLLAILLTLALLPLFVFRTEPVGRALQVCSAKERRSYRWAVITLAVHMTLCCLLIANTGALAPVRTATGVVAFLAGMGFWLWGRRAIGPLRVRRTPDQPPLQFCFHGPFGIVRNPLYFGLLLACVGLGITADHFSVWLSLAACGLALDRRARDEERRLQVQVTEYGTYQRSVKRLIPFVW